MWLGHWAGVGVWVGVVGWSVLLGGGEGKGEVCVCVCVCDMGVDGMVSHMCLLIARGADIPGALRRARRYAAGGMLVDGGSVTMDGSTIANCSGTASS